MAQALRLFFTLPLVVAFAACGVSGVGGGVSTNAGGGGGTGGAPGTGGAATSGSSSAISAGAGGVAATTTASASTGGGGGSASAAGTGGGAMTSSSSVGGAGAGGVAASTSASTSVGASTSASASVGASASASTSVGASTSASTSASTGGFVCFNDSDCPGGSSTPCMTPVCADGACGMNPVAAGADALTQTPGDCQKDQCDGQGNPVPTLDSTDVPGAGDPCVVGSCVGGAPTLTPLTGVACNQNGGKVCAGGACVECLSAGDCPGSNDCHFTICATGQCHIIPTFSCYNPPPCYEGPSFCAPDGCSYTIQKVTGGACPGGVCVGGLGCVACAQYCLPPLPCQVLVCATGGPLVDCTYPSAPQGTSCPGGTCDGNGACL